MSNFPIDGSRRRASRDRLIERFMELVPTVRRAFDVRPGPGERAEWLSLTRHQLEALAALQEGSLTMRCLCERLDISESAGTALSDRLVARGMVARETDPADRRVVRLVLTGEARAMVERYHQMKRTRTAELLSALRRDDLERLVHIYEALASGASPAGDGDEGEPPNTQVPARARRGPTRRARRAPESDTTTAGASS